MKVEKIITVFEDLEIEEATLLSKEEVNHLLIVVMESFALH